MCELDVESNMYARDNNHGGAILSSTLSSAEMGVPASIRTRNIDPSRLLRLAFWCIFKRRETRSWSRNYCLTGIIRLLGLLNQ